MKKTINKFGIGTMMAMVTLALVCSIAIFSGGSQTAFASSDLQVSEAGFISGELFASTMNKYRTSATRESEGFGG